MCGFVGIVNFKRNIKNQENFFKGMVKTLEKRGPDEEGEYFTEDVNLGHRRLSVIDIQNGKQPMSFKYQENTYVIVFNGQIYNSNRSKRFP